MRDINDLKNAFGEADEGFKESVYRTLAELKKRQNKKNLRKISLRLVVAIAVLCLLLTGSALAMAKAWGIFDFLNDRRIGVEVLSEAVGIVQTDLPQEGGKSELAIFSIREAIYDGKNIYIAVDAKPTNPDYLLIGLGMSLFDPVENLGPLFQNNQGITIEEYAKEYGKIPVHILVKPKEINHSVDFVLESDGTLVYMIDARYDTGDSRLELELDCITTPFGDVSINDKNIGTEEIQRSTMVVKLQNNGERNIVTNVSVAEYTDCGVRVEKVTLTGSPMGIYAEIEFIVTDTAKYAETDGGLWFEFIDEKGERLPDGASSSGSILPVEDEENRYVQTGSIRAAETLPSEIILRGYNCWDKSRYESHEFEMK